MTEIDKSNAGTVLNSIMELGLLCVWRYKLCPLMFISVLCLSVINTSAQFKPPASNPVTDIIEKLNADVFQQAEVILVNEGYDGGESDRELGIEIGKVPYQKLQISKGFTASHFKECRLTLENPSGRIKDAFLSSDNPIGYGRVTDFFSDLHRQQKPSKLELEIPLYGLSNKNGKRPHLLSRDPKKANTYGKWGVQPSVKGGFSINLIATDNKGRIEKITGQRLTFVFDDETTSRQFDTDFRKAASICSTFDPKPAEPTVKLPPVVIVN